MDIGGQTLMERQFRRLKRALDWPIYFLTSNDPSDDPVETEALRLGAKVFRGSLHNVLERYKSCIVANGISHFFRVTGDNPLVSTDHILKIAAIARNYDYVDNIHNAGSIIGTGCEFVRSESLLSIPETNEKWYLEHVTTYLRDHPEQFKTLKYVPEDKAEKDKQYYLTCDYPEDFDLLKKIYSHFNYSNDIPIVDILSFLKANPSIAELNKGLHNPPSF